MYDVSATDDEYCMYCACVAVSGADYVAGAGDAYSEAGDDWEGDSDLRASSDGSYLFDAIED